MRGVLRDEFLLKFVPPGQRGRNPEALNRGGAVSVSEPPQRIACGDFR